MGAKRGQDGKLYFKVGGVAGGGQWTELSNAKDVTLNLQAGEADATTRANNGWRATVPTLKEGSIEFEMVWNEADAGFAAIQAAYMAGSAIGLRCLSGAPDGTCEGLEGDFGITNFSRNEPLEEVMTVSVTAKPTYSATAPAWVKPAN